MLSESHQTNEVLRNLLGIGLVKVVDSPDQPALAIAPRAEIFHVQITNADRANGRITGSKAGAAVTIELRPQSDNTLQVIFSAPDSKETSPTLNARWLAVYNQRMGR